MKDSPTNGDTRVPTISRGAVDTWQVYALDTRQLLLRLSVPGIRYSVLDIVLGNRLFHYIH